MRAVLKTKPAPTQGARVYTGRPKLAPALRRVKIDLRVLPSTLLLLRDRGWQDFKERRAASPGATAARILDAWNKKDLDARKAEIADDPYTEKQEAPDPKEPRKRQITAWVLPATAKAIYSASIAKAPLLRSQSRNAGLVIERWAIKETSKARTKRAAQNEATP